MAPRYCAGQRLTTLILRLEAATSRLEDIATSVDSTHPETVAAISTAQATIAENAAAAAIPVAAAAPPEPLPRSIEDFDKLINEDVKAFVSASEAVGGLVQQQVRIHGTTITTRAKYMSGTSGVASL
jgi:adenylyl cyclase-associated protein